MQELPKYTDDLVNWVRRSKENISDEEKKALLKAIRKVKGQADGLRPDTTAYNHFRTSLYELLEKVDEGNKKSIERAIQTAVEEKSRYVAERIARTEAVRARYDAFIARYGEDEDVVAYQWKLGSRHPAEDICDMYAEADLYGLGKGVFPKDAAPENPAHPHCLCHYAPVYRSELKGLKRSDDVEASGNAWLKKQPLRIQEKILGVKGREAWKAGKVGWMEKARNFKMSALKESRFQIILQLHAKKAHVISRPSVFDDENKLVISKAKLTEYCLNEKHPKGVPKAIAFEKYLGYNKDSYDKLDNLIRQNIVTATYRDRGGNTQGHRYEASFFVEDLQGRRIMLVTGWIVDKGTNYPRLITAYLKPEVRGD